MRGLRWQRLVRPIEAVRYLQMLGYLLVGYLMNNILPARLGELVRSHYLGDGRGSAGRRRSGRSSWSGSSTSSSASRSRRVARSS